jgi:hypothetical protein
MSYAEEIVKLRKMVADALANGVLKEDAKDFFEATLIQIMNEAERNRQNCVTQAENHRRQAAMMDGQAGAFASVSSIIYNILNGYVAASQRAKEEEERLAEELKIRNEALKEAEVAQSESPEKDNKKRKRV